ncbi:MAG: chromate transporter [Chloroherpetonaceae bacterium]|nr:chromate transporter [Chthonomonadaceae bacterium]MDW8207727.1 chromate transporter [Chloroherpetonaceae bacterium]
MSIEDAGGYGVARVPSGSGPAPGGVPSLWRVWCVWAALGAQSFGGGVATLALIRQAVVERHRWVDEVEFARCMALSYLVPGINLFALALLLGRRIAGWRGSFVCLSGLVLPSAAITVALTAGYAMVRDVPWVRAAVRGMLPATIGLGFLVSVQIARSVLAVAWRDGRGRLSLSLLLIVVSGMLAGSTRLPVLVILCVAGGIGAMDGWLRSRRSSGVSESRE